MHRHRNEGLGYLRRKLPGHLWEMPDLDDLDDYTPSKLPVDACVTTDLFTLQESDLIEQVAEMMDWRKIRYMPVENQKGNLVGLITSRLLLRHLAKENGLYDTKPHTVRDIMIKEPITVSPQASTMDAMGIMRENKIGCLPVIKGKELVGIITEMDFLRITSRLLERPEKKL